ncbi:MAG: hypothetical protein AAGF12_13575 [Myxococcota bacterium]
MKKWFNSRVGAFLTILIAGACAGCTANTSPTQILVVVNTDFPAADVDRIEIKFRDPDEPEGPDRWGPIEVNQLIIEPSDLPVTVGVFPTGSEEEILVGAFVRGSSITAVGRDARTRFLSDESLVLGITVEQACTGVVCGKTMTCIAGRCAGDTIDPATLPKWDGTDPAMR